MVWEIDAGELGRLDDVARARRPSRQRHAVTIRVDPPDAERPPTTSVTMLSAVAHVDATAEPGPADPDTIGTVLAGIDEHHLPPTWRSYVAAWADAGSRAPVHEIDDDSGPQTLAELLAVPGVSETVTLRSVFGFMAIHGGDLELATDVIASRAAEQSDASYYGVTHPPGNRVHLSSIRYQCAESPALASFIDHVDVVVSVHGYGRRSKWMTLLLGGSNRGLAAHIGGAIAGHLEDYDVVTTLSAIPRELRGLHPANPVNLPAHGGVQLELPPRVRGLSPMSPPPADDGLSAPTRALIDALAAAASTWRHS